MIYSIISRLLVATLVQQYWVLIRTNNKDIRQPTSDEDKVPFLERLREVSPLLYHKEPLYSKSCDYWRTIGMSSYSTKRYARITYSPVIRLAKVCPVSRGFIPTNLLYLLLTKMRLQISAEGEATTYAVTQTDPDSTEV
jgi:hypothetical protein